MMRYRFFVGVPHQKVHARFVQSVLGGEYVTHTCSIHDKEFSPDVFAEDGDDCVWFFNDLYPHLHPKLKGRQVLLKHGLCFGRWLNPERAECINKYMDGVFQTGATQEQAHKRHRIIPEKIKPVGYTILFEIPDIPARKNAVLFSSTCYRNWGHYDNLKGILRNLDPDFEGHVSIHPDTEPDVKRPLLDICARKDNLTLIQSQDELLRAFACCSYNVSGGISSVGSPFWFQRKPVLFVKGSRKWNPFPDLGWARVKRAVGEPLFARILDESVKISHWSQFSAKTVREARPAPSADKVFYPWNHSKDETIKKMREYMKEVEA